MAWSKDTFLPTLITDSQPNDHSFGVFAVDEDGDDDDMSPSSSSDAAAASAATLAQSFNSQLWPGVSQRKSETDSANTRGSKTHTPPHIVTYLI